MNSFVVMMWLVMPHIVNYIILCIRLHEKVLPHLGGSLLLTFVQMFVAMGFYLHWREPQTSNMSRLKGLGLAIVLLPLSQWLFTRVATDGDVNGMFQSAQASYDGGHTWFRTSNHQFGGLGGTLLLFINFMQMTLTIYAIFQSIRLVKIRRQLAGR